MIRFTSASSAPSTPHRRRRRALLFLLFLLSCPPMTQEDQRPFHHRLELRRSSLVHQHRVAKRSRKLGNIHKRCLEAGLDAEYTFVVQVTRELSQILIDRGRSDLWPVVEKVQMRYLRSRCVRRKTFLGSFRKVDKNYRALDLKAKFIFLLSWTHVLFNRRYCRAQVHYLGYCLISYNHAVDGPLFDGYKGLKALLSKSLDEVLQFSRLLMNSLEINCSMLESRPSTEVERCMAMSVEFVVHLVKSSGSVANAGEAALWNINWTPPRKTPVAPSESGTTGGVARVGSAVPEVTVDDFGISKQKSVQGTTEEKRL